MPKRIDKKVRNAQWIPTARELAALLREAHNHMADSLAYFPDDSTREGEEDLSKRIDAALSHYPQED